MKYLLFLPSILMFQSCGNNDVDITKEMKEIQKTREEHTKTLYDRLAARKAAGWKDDPQITKIQKQIDSTNAATDKRLEELKKQLEVN